VSVYREIDREFSAGDRIQFSAPDKALNVANRDLAVIDSIAPDGHGNTRIKARLDLAARSISILPSIATSTTATLLQPQLPGTHSPARPRQRRYRRSPGLINSRFGYVAVSRASHEATVFTDDFAKLAPQLGADVSKTSALRIGQTVSMGQGLGIGIG